MAVLCQQMIDSAYSFIVHTTNPMTDDKNEVYIEMAVGQGETLASANQAGTPYRLTYSKTSKKVEILSLSSYSHGLFASKDGDLVKRNLNYSSLNLDLQKLGAQLGEISVHIEKGFEGQP